MRLLLLNDRIPPENRGGAGIVMWRLALALRERGHEVHVAAATTGDPFTDERDGLPTYHLHVDYAPRWRAWLSLYNPQVSGALRDLYQRVQPDLINAHNIHRDFTYASLAIAHQMNIPAVFSSHDVMPFAYHKLTHFIDPQNIAQGGVESPDEYALPPLYNLRQMRLRYNPLRNTAIRYILQQHTQARTAPSRELCHAHAANGLPPFTVVHNGLDADTFTASAETVDVLRERLGLVGRRVILFAGRLTGAKGTKPLLAALQQVVAQVPDVALLVLSSVPIAQQISDARYTHLRDNHITSGGWLSGEDLAAAYHLADVVTAPSVIFDTFPTVNLEAMATKTPVVATCFGGSHEAVINGETGYIVNPYHIDDFAAKLTHLLTDETARQRMGAAGYARLHRHFSLAQQVDAMLAVYQQALDDA